MSEAEEFSSLLRRECDPFLEVTESELNALYAHYELLKRWNAKLNLTSVLRLEEAVPRHYCESLFLAAHLLAENCSVLDVGSGAGFPGIPIAVVRRRCRVTLAESHQRKAVFLREATRRMEHVTVCAHRARDCSGRFDWVVSRAVRWEDVLPRVDDAVGLLTGEEDAAAVCRRTGFSWCTPLLLPWGERRVLLIGKRTQERSR